MRSNGNSKLVVRADSGPEIGIGHLMRSFALVQSGLRNGWEITFLTNTNDNGLVQVLRQGGVEVVQLKGDLYAQDDFLTTLEYMDRHRVKWICLDGYGFDTRYQKAIKHAGRSLLVVDDSANESHYYADVLLNPNLHAPTLSYSVESYTVMLLGTSYMPLRDEFLRWNGWIRPVPDVGRNVLISFGGGDAVNFTLKVLRALDPISTGQIEVKVVVGYMNPNKSILLQEIENRTTRGVSLEEDVADMSELMAWADVAICSAGTISWELAYMGLPALLAVIADNQTPVVEGLAKTGSVINLGIHTEVAEKALRTQLLDLVGDQQMRQVMSSRGKRLVDGFGSQRVFSCLSTIV